jgi:hypothetical protein
MVRVRQQVECAGDRVVGPYYSAIVKRDVYRCDTYKIQEPGAALWLAIALVMVWLSRKVIQYNKR